jgi:hypothetical protein
LFNSQQIGVRHVLPALPLMLIAVAPWLERALATLSQPRRRVWGAIAAIALCWYALGTLAVAPRYLQYFNLLAGGPTGGHRYLVDSNIDWGQDLIRLADYMDEHNVEQVHLAYFGRVHPAIYGVRFVPLEGPGHKGVAAISPTLLMGRPYYWYRNGRVERLPPGAYTWLQTHEPVARAGAMLIYDLK